MSSYFVEKPTTLLDWILNIKKRPKLAFCLKSARFNGIISIKPRFLVQSSVAYTNSVLSTAVYLLAIFSRSSISLASTLVIFFPKCASICSRTGRVRPSTMLMASPALPKRPVRPMRCRQVSQSAWELWWWTGRSKSMTTGAYVGGDQDLRKGE